MYMENVSNDPYMPEILLTTLRNQKKQNPKKLERKVHFDSICMVDYQTAMQKFLRFLMQPYFNSYCIIGHNSSRLVTISLFSTTFFFLTSF